MGAEVGLGDGGGECVVRHSGGEVGVLVRPFRLVRLPPRLFLAPPEDTRRRFHRRTTLRHYQGCHLPLHCLRECFSWDFSAWVDEFQSLLSVAFAVARSRVISPLAGGYDEDLMNELPTTLQQGVGNDERGREDRMDLVAEVQ